MRLVLVRHGIAVDLAPSDFARTLSPEGERKTEQAMRGLARFLSAEPRILTSPYLRAAETAAILARVGGYASPEETDALTFAGSHAEILSAIREVATSTARIPDEVVLVGHQPILGSLASWLLTGGEGARVHVKKASALALDFYGPATSAMGTLAWFLSPKVLRALG